MRKTSVRELHIHTSELVREAAEGSTIIIERRGEPVAELRPITPRQGITPEQKAKIFARMEKIWASMPQTPDSTQYVSEDRDKY
jgi:prevent-host-death family protein